MSKTGLGSRSDCTPTVAVTKRETHLLIAYLNTLFLLPLDCNLMCEFCSNPFSSEDREASHSDFAGFFSADAIEAALRKYKDASDDGDDSDGT